MFMGEKNVPLLHPFHDSRHRVVGRVCPFMDLVVPGQNQDSEKHPHVEVVREAKGRFCGRSCGEDGSHDKASCDQTRLSPRHHPVSMRKGLGRNVVLSKQQNCSL